MKTSAHPLQSWFPLSMRAKQATAQALNATITAVNRLTQPNSRSGRPQCGECAEHDLIPQGTGARTFASDLSDQSNAATSYDRGYAYLQMRQNDRERGAFCNSAIAVEGLLGSGLPLLRQCC